MPIQNNRFRLAEVNFTPATFQGITRTPIKRDLSAFGESLNKIDERKEKFDQQSAILIKALNDIQFNEADAEWKSNYINKIKDELNSAISFGGYSYALSTATRLAAEALSNPELKGREQANIQYQNWKKGLDESVVAGKLDARTANRLKEQNQYRFVPLLDSSQKVVGFKDWESVGGYYGGAIEKPVNKISLEPLFEETNKLVSQKVKKGTGFTARDNNGKIIDLYSSDSSTITKSSYMEESKEEYRLQEVFDELRIAHPELDAYIEQMKRDDEWEIKKLRNAIEDTTSQTYEADKKKLEILEKRLYSENGLGSIDNKTYYFKANDEYLKGMSSNTIKNMAYKNTYSDSTLGSGLKQTTTKGTNNYSEDGYSIPGNTNFGDKGKTVERTDALKVDVKGTVATAISQMLQEE